MNYYRSTKKHLDTCKQLERLSSVNKYGSPKDGQMSALFSARILSRYNKLNISQVVLRARKRSHSFNSGKLSIASTWVHQRRDSGARALPRRGTRRGSGGQLGPFPLGLASHSQAQARQRRICRPGHHVRHLIA